VWFPAIAPSKKLLERFQGRLEDPAIRKRFFESYKRELLATAESRQNVELLAQIAFRTPISIGCYCEDESRCHRSRLYKIIQKHLPRT
jgi:uncharacterized protein YeaO (DUF488 family)